MEFTIIAEKEYSNMPVKTILFRTLTLEGRVSNVLSSQSQLSAAK
jgi:hypothetical protein